MKLIKTLILLAMLLLVNGLFFEYCVSRDMVSWMTLCLSIFLIAFDVLALKVLAKIIKEALKID